MTVTIDDWINALKSGKFEQAQGYLYRPATNGYCCLGVLCKIGGFDFSDISGDAWVDSFVYDGVDMFQNDQVQEEILNLLDVDYNISADMLATANDRGASFAEIARYLEYVRDFEPNGYDYYPADYNEWSEYID